MNYNKNNSCYLCHNCLHPFFLKSDLQRHLDKKEPCKESYYCLLSNEEIKEQSLLKRYYFYNNICPNNLDISQKIILVNNYNQKLNIIYYLSDIKNENDNKIHNKIENLKIPKNIDECIIMIDGKQRYQCFLCKTHYKKKSSLLDHYNNEELCKRKKNINEILQNVNERIIEQTNKNEEVIKARNMINDTNKVEEMNLDDISENIIDYEVDNKILNNNIKETFNSEITNIYTNTIEKLNHILNDIIEEDVLYKNIIKYNIDNNIENNIQSIIFNNNKNNIIEINNNKKKVKKNISITLKRQVWDKYIGKYIGATKCLCCNLSEIDQLNFTCGHIISHYDGGNISIENLRPICQSCNSSMGTMNMDEFMKSLLN